MTTDTEYRINLTDARRRLDMRSRALGVAPPARMLDEDGGPFDKLRRFCREHEVRLD